MGFFLGGRGRGVMDNLIWSDNECNNRLWWECG